VSRSLDDDAAFNRYIDRRNGKDGLPSALPHGDRRSSHVTGANPVRSP
jgi:hypothetical protein